MESTIKSYDANRDTVLLFRTSLHTHFHSEFCGIFYGRFDIEARIVANVSEKDGLSSLSIYV